MINFLLLNWSINRLMVTALFKCNLISEDVLQWTRLSWNWTHPIFAACRQLPKLSIPLQVLDWPPPLPVPTTPVLWPVLLCFWRETPDYCSNSYCKIYNSSIVWQDIAYFINISPNITLVHWMYLATLICVISLKFCFLCWIFHILNYLHRHLS